MGALSPRSVSLTVISSAVPRSREPFADAGSVTVDPSVQVRPGRERVTMSSLEIHLFGVPRLLHGGNGERVADPLPPGTRSLLGYLLLHRQRPHHRDLLATEFWSDVDDECARNRLRTALWRLRRVLEPAGVAPGAYLITTRRGEVRFNDASDYSLDVERFEQAAIEVTERSVTPTTAQLAAFEATAAVCTSDLLEGSDHPWLVYERERLAQLYLSATARCMERYAELGAIDAAIAAGQRILDRDPLREEVHRRLIGLYRESGQRARSRRQFERCRALLAEELGVEPLPETVAAVAAVQPPTPAPGVERSLEAAVAQLLDATRVLGVAIQELSELAARLQERERTC